MDLHHKCRGAFRFHEREHAVLAVVREYTIQRKSDTLPGGMFSKQDARIDLMLPPFLIIEVTAAAIGMQNQRTCACGT